MTDPVTRVASWLTERRPPSRRGVLAGLVAAPVVGAIPGLAHSAPTVSVAYAMRPKWEAIHGVLISAMAEGYGRSMAVIVSPDREMGFRSFCLSSRVYLGSEGRARVQVYGADRPDDMHGPQWDFAVWAALSPHLWRPAQESWNWLVSGLRLGPNPKIVCLQRGGRGDF